MKKVTFEEVKENFIKVLEEVGISSEKLQKFIKGDITVSGLEFCNAISLHIEQRMIDIYPDWQGFVDSDNINTIWEYNKDALNKESEE